MSVNPRININTISNIKTKNTHFDGVRYYDPSLQRFLGEDPIGFDSNDFNFYRYVSNRPIDLNDPFGLKDILGGINKSAGIYDGIDDSLSTTDKYKRCMRRAKYVCPSDVYAQSICGDCQNEAEDECRRILWMDTGADIVSPWWY